MSRHIILPAVFALAALTFCQTAGAQSKSINEDIEWSHTWITSTGKTDLPHVLVIGDSHVEAYYPSVAKALEGKAYPCKFTTSKSMGDPVLLEQLEQVLKHYRFDVISFNNGLHGREYTAEQYAAYIPKVYKLLRKYGHPRIQWVNTTAERNKDDLQQVDDFNANVVKRNRYVKDFTTKEHIPMIDNYALSEAHPEFYREDGVHFKPDGVAAESKSVTEGILSLLKVALGEAP
ncbi:SGNH/GDSL hydrolase family protein [Compostibacter hankyongensis]|uniref:SGNH/GDSL hydrolase family protein n=1 Tax=Compostibacter hankyongensis TaxID=1007089 RepID=A0ABP8FZM2_9BACT